MSVNYFSFYDTLWSFHVICLYIYIYLYLFVEVVIHLCLHALILENKVTKKWQITSHVMLQKINFTMPLYAQPVVIVTAKRVNNYSQYSKSKGEAKTLQ